MSDEAIPTRRASAWTSLVAVALASTAFAMWPTLRYGFERYTVPKAFSLAVCGAAAAIMLAWRARPSAIRWSAIDLGVILCMGAGLASWLSHGRNIEPASSWFAFYGAGYLIFRAAGRAAEEDESARDRLLDLVVIVAALVALVAVIEASGWILPWGGTRRPQSTFGHRNHVAAYVGVALPIAMARVAETESKVRALLVVPIAIVVIVCRCRSVWLALAVASLLGFVFFGRRAIAFARRRRAGCSLALGAASLGLILGAMIPWPGLHWREANPLWSSLARIGEYESGSGRVRIDQHETGLAILAAHPLLGAGPRAWDDAASEHAHASAGHHALPWTPLPPASPQSDLLLAATETGCIGLAGLAIALFAFIRACVRRIRTGGALEIGPIAIGLLVAGVHALFDSPLSRAQAIAQIAVLAGCAAPPRGAAWALIGPRVAWRIVAAGLALAIVLPASLEAAATAACQRGGYDVGARREAMRWFPRVQDAQEILIHSKDPCSEAFERAWLLAEAPHHWGILVQAAKCARSRGLVHEARALLDDARSIEPHYDAGGIDVHAAR